MIKRLSLLIAFLTAVNSLLLGQLAHTPFTSIAEAGTATW